MYKVSVDSLPGDRFKLRWREYSPIQGPDGQPVRKAGGKVATQASARSFTVEGKQARDETRADIIAALRSKGTWEPPTAPTLPTVCNLERASVRWLAFKATRCEPISVRRFTDHMRKWFTALRAVKGIKADQVVPADALDRDAFVACVRQLQEEKFAVATVYAIARSSLEMWTWAADDPQTHPGVITPPRVSASVLPRPPRYSAPTSPTIAELDACLRYLPPNAMVARRAGILLRFTGLRITQAMCIIREDVDLVEKTITVRVGKTAAETAAARIIPISPHLLTELEAWIRATPAGQSILSSRRASLPGAHSMHSRRRPETFKTAWKKATEAGLVRERVWNPPNRSKARPEHAFRAGLQAFWRSREVEEVVIDALVGHATKTTRDRHYAEDALLEKMRRAVEMLPPVDWEGAGAGPASAG